MTTRDDLQSDFSGFHLSGDLTAERIARIHRHSLAACRKGDLPDQIDLKAVTRTDSSVLALLLEWETHAQLQGRGIDFVNPPEDLRVLASLSQVDELLGWGQPDSQVRESK